MNIKTKVSKVKLPDKVKLRRGQHFKTQFRDALYLSELCFNDLVILKDMLARRLRAKIWPDCAIPDTSMKFGTVVDHT